MERTCHWFYVRCSFVPQNVFVHWGIFISFLLSGWNAVCIFVCFAVLKSVFACLWMCDWCVICTCATEHSWGADRCKHSDCQVLPFKRNDVEVTCNKDYVTLEGPCTALHKEDTECLDSRWQPIEGFLFLFFFFAFVYVFLWVWFLRCQVLKLKVDDVRWR